MGLRNGRFLLLLSLSVLGADALADSQVTWVKVGGVVKQCAQDVWVAEPKKQAGRIQVCKDRRFPAGTIIEMPAGTSMELHNTDASGNTVTLDPFSKVQLSASAKGESHRSLFGKILYKVKTRLSFFRVTDPTKRVQAAVPGTEFTTVITGDGIRFEKLEGTVKIDREVRVEIRQPGDGPAGSGGNEKKRSRDLVTHKFAQLEGNIQVADYPFDYYEKEVERFSDHAEAKSHFNRQLDGQGNGRVSELQADLNSTLGLIYLDEGQPGEAVGYFRQALSINEQRSPDGLDPFLAESHTDLGYAYMDLGQHDGAISQFRAAFDMWCDIDAWDPMLAESMLDLADAYNAAGDYEEAESYAQAAFNRLDQVNQLDLQDYDDAVAEGDLELAQWLAQDIADNYESMGFALQAMGQHAEADQYFRKAEAIDAEVNSVYGDEPGPEYPEDDCEEYGDSGKFKGDGGECDEPEYTEEGMGSG